MPVMVVAAKDKGTFERAIAAGAPVTLDVAGRTSGVAGAQCRCAAWCRQGAGHCGLDADDGLV
jgi:hypothetical protein